jgi:hypothetical protein
MSGIELDHAGGRGSRRDDVVLRRRPPETFYRGAAAE